MNELQLFGQRLQIFWQNTRQAPRLMWEGTGGSANLGNRLLLILTVLLLAAGLVAYVICFIRAKAKGKLSMLLWTVILLLFFTVLLFFATRDTVFAVELPEAETYSSGEETLRVYPQYSLARGAEDPIFPLVRAYWQLRDDVITWELREGLVLQLTGLHCLSGEDPFAVTQLTRYGDMSYVSLQRSLGTGGIQNAEFFDSYLEIKIFPDCLLTDMPWYGEVGHICDEDDMHYTVLDNAGGRLVMREQNDGWINGDGILLGLSEARQLGAEVVYIVHRLNHYKWAMAGSTFYNQDPAEDRAYREQLQEPIDALFDSRIHLYRDLDEETLAAILPDCLIDFPVREASAGGFTLPCEKLLDMADTEDGTSQLRLAGPGLRSEPTLYTLLNGGTAYLAGNRTRYQAWREAYEAGKKTPDTTITEFLGCPAVAYEGGWLLNPGTFYNPDTDTPFPNYYYLTMDPWTP